MPDRPTEPATSVPGSAATGGRGSRSRRGPWSRAVTWAALVLLAGLPVLAGVRHHERAGWYPEGDDATIVLLSGDTFTSHPPLVGMISTGGAALRDPELHHPGPIELYLLAPLSRLGTDPGTGATLTVALVSLASLAGLAFVLRAIGGRTLAAVGLVGGALALWGLGGDVAISVWNPYVVALPFACFVALVAATVSTRPSMLPGALVVGSFVVQTHLSYVGTVGLLSAWALGVTAWTMWSERSDPLRRAAHRRIVLTSAAVTGALWAPPVFQQLTGHPGNLGQIWHSLLGGTGETVGPRALGEFGRVVGLPVVGLRPHPDLVRILGDVTPAAAAACTIVGLVTVALMVVAWRSRQRSTLCIAATVAVALLGGAVTATRMPLAGGVLYQYYALWMWPLGAVAWLLIGWCAWQLLDGHRAGARAVAPTSTAPGSAPASDGPAWSRRPLLSALALAMTLGLVAALPRPGAWAPWSAYRRIAGTVVPDTVRALPHRGRYLVRFRGSTPYLSTGSAVVLGVEHAGSSTLVDPGPPTPVFPWTERRRYVGQTFDGELWVVSGSRPADLPSGARLVASSEALTAAERAKQAAVQRHLLAAVGSEGITRGPRSGATATDRARVDAAIASPTRSLLDGDLADLAARGLVRAPGGDLDELFTAARMQVLAAEGSVRVYLVAQRS